jgi:hypothetical protein
VLASGHARRAVVVTRIAEVAQTWFELDEELGMAWRTT